MHSLNFAKVAASFNHTWVGNLPAVENALHNLFSSPLEVWRGGRKIFGCWKLYCCVDTYVFVTRDQSDFSICYLQGFLTSLSDQYSISLSHYAALALGEKVWECTKYHELLTGEGMHWIV